MPTGPISCFGEVSPVKSPDERPEDQPGVLPVLLDAHLHGFERPRLDLLDLVANLDPDHPERAALDQGHVDFHGTAVAQNVHDGRLVDVLADLFRQLTRGS